MKRLSIVAVALFLLLTNGGSHGQSTFDGCDETAYYQPLALVDDAPPSRVALQGLLTTSHRRFLPYTDNDSEIDVWRALMDLDAGATVDSVQLVYRQVDMPNADAVKGTTVGWNREHLWPKSRGVGESGPDFTDIHHLVPSDWNVNAARGNKWFGACSSSSSSSSSDDCTTPAHPEAAFDTAASRDTFLPPAAARGHIARALFYMDLRYAANDNNERDLQLTNCLPTDDTANTEDTLGYLSQLVAWHNEFPVTDDERQRNQRACANWQGNRNPFVDHPEWVATFFGDGTGLTCDDLTPILPPTNNGNCPGPGSIMFIGVNTDNPDAIALVALQDLAVGTTLYLTDNAWTGSNLGTTEGIWRTTLTTALPAGTVWGPLVSSLPIWEPEQGSLALSAEGDSLLLYCLDETDDTDEPAYHWVAGISLQGDDTVDWPTALDNNAVTLDHVDNARYVGPSTGTAQALVDAIRQPGNWEGSNADRFPLGASEQWGTFEVNENDPSSDSPSVAPNSRAFQAREFSKAASVAATLLSLCTLLC